MTEFSSWLDAKLVELGTDARVFSPYITSILEGEDEGEEEKDEGITAILADVLNSEDLINSVLKEIKDRWDDHQSKVAVTIKDQPKEPKLDLNDQLNKIMEEKMSNFSIQKKEPTAEEKKLKAAILASYSTVDDGSEEEDDNDDDDDLGSNANVKAVQEAQLAWREGQKEAAMAKREKDKQDRKNQKEQGEERKKKAQEKTAKRERRGGR